jgi:hypothetical protein
MRDKDGIIYDPYVPRAGQRITAKCSLVGRTPENMKSVSWHLQRQNDGKNFFLGFNSQVFQFTKPIQRLFAYHEATSNDWYLVFDPLDRDDIGNLTCAMSDTGFETASLTRYLDVHSEPIILESSTKDIEVGIGEDVTLECISQGYPKPTISWVRANGRPLPDGNAIFYVSLFYFFFDEFLKEFSYLKGNQLKIKKINKEDRGVFLCLSSNLIGSGAQWTVKVAVRCMYLVYGIIKVSIIFCFQVSPYVQCQKSVGQAPNFEVDVYMECFAHGYPAPRLG